MVAGKKIKRDASKSRSWLQRNVPASERKAVADAIASHRKKHFAFATYKRRRNLDFLLRRFYFDLLDYIGKRLPKRGEFNFLDSGTGSAYCTGSTEERRVEDCGVGNCEGGRCVFDSPDWGPTWWSGLMRLYETPETVEYGQYFSWDEANLRTLKEMNVHYQWELRRYNSQDYWDYAGFGLDPESNFGKYYYTNLPRPRTDEFTEEVGQGWDCPFKELIGQSCDEEFELKTGDVDSIKPDYTYIAKAVFTRKRPGLSMHVQSESEYCGKLLWCYDPTHNLDPRHPYFGFFIMTEEYVTS